jgi:hypothetical protein
MGRSYSFEPFRSQQPAQVFKGSGAKLGNDESKVTLAKDEEQATTTQLPSASAHYGHNHAETVTRYQKKAQARKRAAKAPAAQAKSAAKKATAKPAARPAATTPARKQAASATTPRMTTGTAKTEKTPSRKTVAAAPEAVRSLGRKVLTRAATAAKKGVASVVKKATKVATKATTTARKATKKR